MEQARSEFKTLFEEQHLNCVNQMKGVEKHVSDVKNGLEIQLENQTVGSPYCGY